MTSLAEKPLLMGTKREFFLRKLIFPFSRTEQKVCKSRASSKRKREKLFKAAMMPELTYDDRLLSLAVITKDNETSDWLCRAMYGCVGLCRAEYGYVGLCRAV